MKATAPTGQEDFILHVHAMAPGLTERSIGVARTKTGATSYEAFCDFVRPHAGMSVLDLACGNGPLTELLAQRVGSSGRVTAVDLSAEELAAAQQRLARFPWVTYRHEPADRISLPAASVDLIACHMAFMLFSPLDAAVTEAARLLKRGGHFAAVIPTLRKPSALFAACAGVLKESLIADGLEREAISGNGVRMADVDDLKRIFPPDQWRTEADIEIVPLEVGIEAEPELLLKYVVPAFYSYRLLPDNSRRKLEDAWLSRFRAEGNGDGRTVFKFPLAAFRVARR